MATRPRYLLEFRNITKLYQGIRALHSVDFSLQRGEIHCLVGENGSGKSTLIKIISGVVAPEEGATMRMSGNDIDALRPREMLRRGLRVIYQDLGLFPNLSVGENIAFGRYRETAGIFVRRAAVVAHARAAMDMIGLAIDTHRIVSSLSIAEQQQVEIARALVGDLRLLILDEPTASLTRVEVDRLFEIIGKLQARGITTLFVSHKLNEVFEIAEQVTVLRDGEKVGVFAPDELDHRKLVQLMTGSELSAEAPQPLAETAKELLRVESLSRRRGYKNVSFTLKQGEILGVIGRLGSGRSELAMSLFGMNPAESGRVVLDGRELRIRNNRAAMKAGIAYVPEHRLVQGLVMPQSLHANLGVTVLKRFLNKMRLLDAKKLRALAKRWVERLAIKISRLEVPVRTLSGGNQQKVVLAKWLARGPRILLLDEPTVGIDVLAKNSVHDLIKQLAAEGMGIMLISDEVHEVLTNCHRVLVMDGGRIVDEVFPGPEAEQQLLERFNLA